MKQEYIITIFSENNIGLLNRITINFTRRKINIESLTVSQSAISGISKFIIVVNETEERVKRLVAQLDKIVDVLKTFYHTSKDMIFAEMAMYKISTEFIYGSDELGEIVRTSGAQIIEITKEFIIIEKSGLKKETQELFDKLSKFGVMQFVRSGRIAVTRDRIERLSEFLKERDNNLENLN